MRASRNIKPQTKTRKHWKSHGLETQDLRQTDKEGAHRLYTHTHKSDDSRDTGGHTREGRIKQWEELKSNTQHMRAQFRNKTGNNRITKAGSWQKKAAVVGIVAMEGGILEVVLNLCSKSWNTTDWHSLFGVEKACKQSTYSDIYLSQLSFDTIRSNIIVIVTHGHYKWGCKATYVWQV